MVGGGHRSVDGSAEVMAMAVHLQVPLHVGRFDASTLTVGSTACDDVPRRRPATFIPSVSAQTRGAAVVSGHARCTGIRVG